MKLRYSPTSPYVRKVMILAIERGLRDQIEIIPADFSIVDPAFLADNPLRKVPTLILDDGSSVFDSPVVCEYLDSLPGGRHLFPADGPARWTALTRQALADGITDAGVLALLDARRPDGERSPSWIERQRAVALRGLRALDHDVPTFPADIDIGTVAVIAAVGFIDWRLADLGWRPQAPALADWFDAIQARPSVRDTAPPV